MGSISLEILLIRVDDSGHRPNYVWEAKLGILGQRDGDNNVQGNGLNDGKRSI